MLPGHAPRDDASSLRGQGPLVNYFFPEKDKDSHLPTAPRDAARGAWRASARGRGVFRTGSPCSS